MSILRGILVVVVVALAAAAAYLAGAWFRLYGRHEGPGAPTSVRVPAPVVSARAQAQARAATAIGGPPSKQILFGDLHVHSTFSTDAFLYSLPMLQGTGAHPIADACDYARFCSALDFWSINDHAEASTPQRWQETKEAIRACNAVAGRDLQNPDVAVFLGWEWSQMGFTPQNHYGHKNVVFRGLADREVPARPIGAAGLATDGMRAGLGELSPLLPLFDFPHRQRYYNFSHYMREIRDVPLCPTGVNRKKPMELRTRISSFVSCPVTTMGSVKSRRPLGRSTRCQSRKTFNRPGRWLIESLQKAASKDSSGNGSRCPASTT